ncbi:MAG: hypothetical protein ABW007_28315 [Chitinophagaceae bacterium]
MRRVEKMKKWVNEHQDYVSVALVSSGVTMIVVGTVALVAVVKAQNENSGARQTLDDALPGSKLIMPVLKPDGTNVVLTKIR